MANSFPVFVGSERQRKIVVGGIESAFDELEPAGFVEGAPAPRGGPQRLNLGDLLDGPVLDERTDAVAISHGAAPLSLFGSLPPPARGAVRGGTFLRRRLES